MKTLWKQRVFLCPNILFLSKALKIIIEKRKKFLTLGGGGRYNIVVVGARERPGEAYFS